MQTNVTTDTGLTGEMKTYYSKYIVDTTEPKLVHGQFGQKHPIPKNGGKTIEFRKYNSLPKMVTPLSEGITPDGQKLNMSVLSCEIKQYGGFIEMSDVLMLTAIDNNLMQATKMMGSQAGRTLDTITREELNGGTNVLYAGNVTARHLLCGGSATASENNYLTVDTIKRAVRFLKVMNAETIDTDYVAIIHPDNTYDLTNDPEWKAPHQYVDTRHIYSGEIGKIAGCRFVESTEAKIFHAANLTKASRELTVRTAISAATPTVAVKEAITAAEALALVGRKVMIGAAQYEIVSATAGVENAASIKLGRDVSAVGVNEKVCPGEAGAGGRDVYSTLVLGANAYGETEISGGGLEHIAKQLGSAGTSDPLNQRATAGWKATKASKRLAEEYMIRVESCSTFQSGGN